jgi:hypothetical protein
MAQPVYTNCQHMKDTKTSATWYLVTVQPGCSARLAACFYLYTPSMGSCISWLPLQRVTSPPRSSSPLPSVLAPIQIVLITAPEAEAKAIAAAHQKKCALQLLQRSIPHITTRTIPISNFGPSRSSLSSRISTKWRGRSRRRHAAKNQQN